MKYKYSIVSLIALLGLSISCVPYNKLVNYRNDYPITNHIPIANPPQIKIQPNDVLSIKVFSSDMATAEPFNISPTQDFGFNSIDVIQLQGYLVDSAGNIDFPVLGSIQLKGLSVSEAQKMLKSKLEQYINDPVINMRLINFRITVSGEVTRPGAFNIINERISIPEAISLAGGLTNYANRSNILLVREKEDVRSFYTVDLLSADVFQSEYFYLKQNDFLYVEPIKAKTGAINDQSTKTIPIITAAGTFVAVIVSILSIKQAQE